MIITFTFSIATFDGSPLPSPITVEVGASADAGVYVAEPLTNEAVLDMTPPAANRAEVRLTGRIVKIVGKLQAA